MAIPEPLRRELQDKLDRRARALDSVNSIMGAQQHMPAGSHQRDATMKGVGEGLDEAGKLTDELRKSGVIDSYGQLTQEAHEMGLKRPWRAGDPLG